MQPPNSLERQFPKEISVRIPRRFAEGFLRLFSEEIPGRIVEETYGGKRGEIFGVSSK